MIVGAMKSGSTTLYEYLDRHPKIFMCSPKEPMFFSQQEKYAKGLDWYFSLFRDADDGQVCGEASTCYSRWPYFGDVAGRIHSTLPDTRFIYIMRHPVNRAYSHYRHLMEERRGKSSARLMTFEEAIEQEPEIVDTSLYRLQLEKFLDYFPQERLHLLFFEEMKANPRPEIEKVLRFLGLEPAENLTASKLAANVSGSQIAKRDMEALVDAVRHTPGVSTLVNLLPARLRALIRSRLTDSSIATLAMRRQIATFHQQISPLETPMRKRLLERFRIPNRELERLMGRSVPDAWRR